MKFWILTESRMKSLIGVLILDFLFSGEISEQSDKVAQEPDFWVRTTNNDIKHKYESYEN